MGICASISSPVIHDDSYGHENGVYYTGISSNGSSPRIGSIYSHAGSNGLNQDCAILFQGYGVEEGAMCAVFDGHGKNGHIVSKIVRNRLPSLLLNHRKMGSDQSKNFQRWKDACITAFKAVDREIQYLETLDCSCSGTTATVVVRQGEDLTVANLGDSRAVLGTRSQNGIMAVQLTTDLKPGVPSEAERIRKCRGRVFALKEEAHIERVWLPYDDSPGLAMSRAFGDFVLKNNGIICIPEVSHRRITPDDAFLVVASDGVWDVMSNEEVVSMVAAAGSEEEAAKVVVDAAMAAWKHKFPNSKRDDCTVICLFLH
ncbi:probable protein phosphatase 2C 72 [Salvia miltiorrhiza]|uniref:probable protein phosphatase 2C 72 n=1 Tax=Salvia miltiorrhiza TaxID=226208 RepID=UPI0025AC5AD7|nr:probable protein phosphatase 2C 72 [Salvia miltiorrhiza]